MKKDTKNRKFGWVWVVISPILWIMAAISTVESLTVYYIQFVCISLISIIGLVAGAASLMNMNWAYVALKYISWISFFIFSGSGIVMFLYITPLIFRGDHGGAALVFPISLGVIATGLPFCFMAMKWR